MHKYFVIIFLSCILHVTACFSQVNNDTVNVKQWLNARIDTLADTAMHGRGYVANGREMAAEYIQREFRSYGIKPIGRKKSFTQSYSFPVNTFPGKMELGFNGLPLQPGKDFLVDAASHSFSGVKLAVEKVNLQSINNIDDWQKKIAAFQSHGKVYLLENIDSACKRIGIRKHYLPFVLPKGCFIIPTTEKFTWDVQCETTDATVLYVKEDAIPAKIDFADALVDAEYLSDAESVNIIGKLEGDVKDTFVAITAHYDHLGMMGSQTVFPGASDNASGTAMLLYMANYFSTHPHHYSILFICFSGEEPGMLGSEYFVRHPKVPLGQIKFLTNIDIMGDATNGITVVNATEFPKQFALLQQLNSAGNLLPQVVSRGKASNSDHYYFTEAGVPSFFIYSNGGKGYYHDIFDKASEITLVNVASFARLLINFLTEIK